MSAKPVAEGDYSLPHAAATAAAAVEGFQAIIAGLYPPANGPAPAEAAGVPALAPAAPPGEESAALLSVETIEPSGEGESADADSASAALPALALAVDNAPVDLATNMPAAAVAAALAAQHGPAIAAIEDAATPGAGEALPAGAPNAPAPTVFARAEPAIPAAPVPSGGIADGTLPASAIAAGMPPATAHATVSLAETNVPPSASLPAPAAAHRGWQADPQALPGGAEAMGVPLTAFGDTSARLMLRPAAIGVLDIGISIDAGETNVEIQPGSEAARQAIEPMLPRLVRALEARDTAMQTAPDQYASGHAGSASGGLADQPRGDPRGSGLRRAAPADVAQAPPMEADRLSLFA